MFKLDKKTAADSQLPMPQCAHTPILHSTQNIELKPPRRWPAVHTTHYTVLHTDSIYICGNVGLPVGQTGSAGTPIGREQLQLTSFFSERAREMSSHDSWLCVRGWSSVLTILQFLFIYTDDRRKSVFPIFNWMLNICAVQRTMWFNNCTIGVVCECNCAMN